MHPPPSLPSPVLSNFSTYVRLRYNKTYRIAQVGPKSPALVSRALPARVRRRAFLNTASAMRGNTEDAFLCALGSCDSCCARGPLAIRADAEDSVFFALGSRSSCARGAGDAVGHFRNDSASDFAERWLEHGNNPCRMPRRGDSDVSNTTMTTTTTTTTTTTITTTTTTNNSNNDTRSYTSRNGVSSIPGHGSGRHLPNEGGERDHAGRVAHFSEKPCLPSCAPEHDAARQARAVTHTERRSEGKEGGGGSRSRFLHRRTVGEGVL